MKKIIPVVIILILSITFLGLHNIDEKEELKPNMKEESNKFTIASYINGVPSSEMPNDNSNLFGYVKCYDTTGNEIDALGFVKYENNKWNVNIENITLSSKCNVYFIDPPAHWTTAEEGTLLKAIKDNNPVENTKTIPGKQINLPDEALLSGTIDDYGTSYYFRGNVQNNYVQFADKCWRIVRVDGNGNIKLWLWNNANNCTANSVPKSAFNINREHNAYIGFMYGNVESDKFSTEDKNGVHDNIYDSDVLHNLKDWYDTTFETNDEDNPTKYTNLLADVIWCSDKSIYSGLGLAKLSTKYGAYERISLSQKPSLKCPDAGNNNKISKYTAAENKYGNSMLKTKIENTDPIVYKYYKTGLITADEVAFAGSNNLDKNILNYLYTGEWYWTMSPIDYHGHYARVYLYSNNGILTIKDNVSYSNKFHPAIALNYDIQATYDKTDLENNPAGSVNNPYVISI